MAHLRDIFLLSLSDTTGLKAELCDPIADPALPFGRLGGTVVFAVLPATGLGIADLDIPGVCAVANELEGVKRPFADGLSTSAATNRLPTLGDFLLPVAGRLDGRIGFLIRRPLLGSFTAISFAL
jgi:hypothetical protein